jgi:hypothetical protein
VGGIFRYGVVWSRMRCYGEEGECARDGSVRRGAWRAGIDAPDLVSAF